MKFDYYEAGSPTIRARSFIMKDAEILEKNRDKRTKCLVYTRVMGYHRPTESFNTGKVAEFSDRRFFTEPTK